MTYVHPSELVYSFGEIEKGLFYAYKSILMSDAKFDDFMYEYLFFLKA